MWDWFTPIHNITRDGLKNHDNLPALPPRFWQTIFLGHSMSDALCLLLNDIQICIFFKTKRVSVEHTNVWLVNVTFLFLLFWFVSLLLHKTYSHWFFPIISIRYILINGTSELCSAGTGHVVSFKSCLSVSWSFHPFLMSLSDMDLVSFSRYQSQVAQWTQALNFMVLLHQQLSDFFRCLWAFVFVFFWRQLTISTQFAI